MRDNLDVAVLTSVNELAARYGIRPTEFVATFSQCQESGEWALRYETSVSGDEAKIAKFAAMLKSIGVSLHSGELTGTADSIYDALEKSLLLAPRQFGRGRLGHSDN